MEIIFCTQFMEKNPVHKPWKKILYTSHGNNFLCTSMEITLSTQVMEIISSKQLMEKVLIEGIRKLILKTDYSLATFA